MQYTAELKSKGTMSAVIAALFASGAVLYAASVVADVQSATVYDSLLGILGITAVIFGLYLLMRYRLLKFVYVVRPADDEDVTALAPTYASLERVPYYMLDLAVFKISGVGKAVRQCTLSLGDLKEALPDVDRSALKEIKQKYKAENGGKFVCYDYTVNPKSKDALCLVFTDGGEYVGVVIEADEVMRCFFEEIGT